MRWPLGVAAIALLLLIPLEDTHPVTFQDEFERASKLFEEGYLEKSQEEAKLGFLRSRLASPSWAEKFQLLEANSMLFRGMYGNALQLLTEPPPANTPSEDAVRRSVIETVGLTRQNRLEEARNQLHLAQSICDKQDVPPCGDVSGAAAILADKEGRASEAWQFFLDSFGFAKSHHEMWSEAAAALNLGFAAMKINHFDEATGWSKNALRAAETLGAEDLAQSASATLVGPTTSSETTNVR